MNYGLSRMERLTKSSQFIKVRDLGFSVKRTAFWIQVSLADDQISKLGVIASKRVGNAVHRNRAKRLIRELYRKHKSYVPNYRHTVVIPRKAIFKISYTELDYTFKDALIKASNIL